MYVSARGRRPRHADRLRGASDRPDGRAERAGAGSGRGRGDGEVSQDRGRLLPGGPLFGATRLAGELAALEKTGALKVPDPERAAWQFVDLCQSYVYKRILFGVVDRITPEEIEAAVVAGVDVFLKAYGT